MNTSIDVLIPFFFVGGRGDSTKNAGERGERGG